MTRSIYILGLAAASIIACDSHPVAPQRAVKDPSAGPVASVGTSSDGTTIIVSFETMYGVDEAFINSTKIRDVLGDELPWQIGSAVGSLTTSGHLTATIRGLVFTHDPEVPPELRGKNDETEFRALVSCLVSESKKGKGKPKIKTVNITTAGFPAATSGDSNIDTNVQLPADCVAPIIFILSGSEDKWFAVLGGETVSET